jgi:16S rRNA (guanine966-N2)-methyltransferase
VRETLFNWLQGEIDGAAVLDLFAGSGALGVEALSRGAAFATFVENHRGALVALAGNLEWVGDRCELVRASAWRFLQGAPGRRYGLVFLDPPYGRGWAARAAQQLQAGGWLAPHAVVYVETGADEGEPDVPAGWALRRHGTAGDVAYRLYDTHGEETA